MQIWVDADACPAAVKDILFRAAERLRIPLVLVANQPLRTPGSRHVRTIQVPRGFDVADERIAAEARAGDLVITADIPLAAKVIEKGAHALDPRGQLYTPDNIREHLSLRNFMSDLRGSGVDTGGPAAMNARDRQAFASRLDKWLAERLPRTTDRQAEPAAPGTEDAP